MNNKMNDIYLKSIAEIDFLMLKENGIKGIIFDLDNLMLPQDYRDPENNIINLVNYLVVRGFKVGVITTNKLKIHKFSNNKRLSAISSRYKNFKEKLDNALKAMKTDRCNTILIGDQVFMDVNLKGSCNMTTILVEGNKRKPKYSPKFSNNIESKKYNFNFLEKGDING